MGMEEESGWERISWLHSEDDARIARSDHRDYLNIFKKHRHKKELKEN